MINYSDYAFYSEEYKGSLSQTLFNSLIVKASRLIDTKVNRQITEEDLDDEKIGYKIQYTACLLCDELKGNDKNKNVSSISIDGVHKTYIGTSERKKVYDDIFEHLPEELTRYI